MILTRLNKSSKSPIPSTLVSFLLLVILTACGTNPVIISSPPKPHPSSTVNKPIKTPTAIPSPYPSSTVNKRIEAPTAIPSPATTFLNLNVENITEDAGSLRIQSVGGFQCPNDQ